MPIYVDWCRRIGLHWPNTLITIHRDSHYGRREAIGLVRRMASTTSIGLRPSNAVLAAQVFTKTDDVCVRRATANLDLVRDYTETRYGAKSWSHPRRVVARIEATRKISMSATSLPTSPTVRRLALRQSLLRTWTSGEPDQAAQEPVGVGPDQLSIPARQPDAADPAHRRLLADAEGARCHSLHATFGQWRILHHPPAVAEEDCSADQGDYDFEIKLAFANCPDATLFRGMIGALILRPT